MIIPAYATWASVSQQLFSPVSIPPASHRRAALGLPLTLPLVVVYMYPPDFVPSLAPISFSPLHRHVPPSIHNRHAIQMQVGAAELELNRMIEATMFQFADTLTHSTNAPLFESHATKVNVMATFMQLLRSLIGIEGMTPVRRVPSSSTTGGGISSLNFDTRRRRNRNRIVSRDEWSSDREDDSELDDDDERQSQSDEEIVVDE